MVEAARPLSPIAVTFAPIWLFWLNVVPLVERSTLNPVSLLELSVQDRLILLDDTAVAVRLVGVAGVPGVGVGVGVAVGVAVGVGVGVGVVVGVDVGHGVGTGIASMSARRGVMPPASPA